MNKSSHPISVSECKIQASVLLKSLRSANIEHSHRSAKRFLILPQFKNLTLTEIIQVNIKRKHALEVVAVEKGFQSWADLKCQMPFILGGFLNHWFVAYQEAKTFLQAHKGYLFPYKKHFFICDANYIHHLGFDPDDPDWKFIEFDWVRPANRDAFQRLHKKWMKIQGDFYAKK